ncbi:hypothetical protein IWQ62_005907 [Dispira parvispora]|uniref:Peroxisomal membrane protein PEX16 n=1 Tax=Dispira parvispora TaxID=1520584 RepID=A0A9W8AP17_9FUNG|nr:hypothetical protein IWQ62_005907 [Dispira parvispora]
MPFAKLAQAYERFLLNNASQISSIESTVRSLTYVLPGRFSDADVASEGLYALLNVLGLYHDHILTKAARQTSSAKPDTSLLNRYHRYFFRHSAQPGLYQRLGLALTLLQFAESFIEMAIQKKWGTRAKWQAVTAIELAKLLCRLALIRNTQNRMLFQPSYPERDVDPEVLRASTNTETPPSAWQGKHTGKQYPSVASLAQGVREGQPLAQYISARSSQPEQYLKPSEVVLPLSRSALLGEYLFALRPVLYVLAIRKWGHKAWLPWLLSLAIESLSRLLQTTACADVTRQGHSGSRSQLERAELGRRLWLFLNYLLRSPFYDRFTKPRLDRFIKSAQQKPIISLFAGLLSDYQPLWESVYFYTSGS